jgi:hypothetical protein
METANDTIITVEAIQAIPAISAISISIPNSESGEQVPPYYEAHACAICLEEFAHAATDDAATDDTEHQEPKEVTLSCGHTFHFECTMTLLLGALRTNKDFCCPMCRNIEIRANTPEYLKMYRHYHDKLCLLGSSDSEEDDARDARDARNARNPLTLTQRLNRSGIFICCMCILRLLCIFVTLACITSMIISVYMILRR